MDNTNYANYKKYKAKYLNFRYTIIAKAFGYFPQPKGSGMQVGGAAAAATIASAMPSSFAGLLLFATLFYLNQDDGIDIPDDINVIKDYLCDQLTDNDMAFIETVNSDLRLNKTPTQIIEAMGNADKENVIRLANVMMYYISAEQKSDLMEKLTTSFENNPAIKAMYLQINTYFAEHPEDSEFALKANSLIHKSMNGIPLDIDEKAILHKSIKDLVTCRKNVLTFMSGIVSNIQNNQSLRILAHQVNLLENAANSVA